MLLVTFKSMSSYSDHVFQLKQHGAYTDSNIIRQEVTVLQIDWRALHQVVIGAWGLQGLRCPLCFWNDQRLVYFTPKVQANGSRWTVEETWAKCPCILYDLDIINKRDSRNHLVESALEIREYFKSLQINWNDWIDSLKNGHTYHQPSAPALPPPASSLKQLADVF